MKTEIKEGDMRVWMIRNVPNAPKYKNVNNLEEAKEIIKKAINKDLKDSSVYDSVFGLEVWEEVDGKYQWCEWYSDETGNDICEEIDEEEDLLN